MGGSLALALRDRCKRLLAVDPDVGVRKLAIERGVVDVIAASPEDLLAEADLVILAAPVVQCLRLIERLPDLHPGAPVVMDLASTKVEIVRALERLPDRFDLLPAHPMCGKETGGLANATPELFSGAVLVFTPLERTSPAALDLGEEIAAVVRSTPLRMSPELHDAWVASTSHLPYLLAAALAAATPEDVRALIGPGFRSTVRLAGSDPDMMADVLLTNRTEVRAALAGLKSELVVLEQILADGDGDLIRQALEAARRKYNRLLFPGTDRDA